MRITSGNARGISLDAPKGDATRPATDAARQAIFSSLSDAICGAKVLDVFAGTGSYGLEAISRGAAEATFVEADKRAVATLRRNIESVGKALRTAGETPAMNVLPIDCLKGSICAGKKFDFVFADPPYAMLLDAKTLSKICAMFCRLAAEGTVFVLEAPAEFSLPEKFSCEVETLERKFSFKELNRLGKKSRGKPSQIIFKIEEVL